MNLTLTFQTRLNQPHEQAVGAGGPGLELGVGPGGEVVGMMSAVKFNERSMNSVGRPSGDVPVMCGPTDSKDSR